VKRSSLNGSICLNVPLLALIDYRFFVTGESGQREVRDILSAKMWCTCLRIAGRHYRGEAKDGDDGICLPDGDGLHPEHEFHKKSTQQRK